MSLEAHHRWHKQRDLHDHELASSIGVNMKASTTETPPPTLLNAKQSEAKRKKVTKQVNGSGESTGEADAHKKSKKQGESAEATLAPLLLQSLATDTAPTLTPPPADHPETKRAEEMAAALLAFATPSRGKYGVDGSTEATQPLLLGALAAAIAYGSTFVEAPPFTAAAAAVDEISRAALSDDVPNPHMVTSGSGASFLQTQRGPNLVVLTYPLGTDAHAVTTRIAFDAVLRTLALTLTLALALNPTPARARARARESGPEPEPEPDPNPNQVPLGDRRTHAFVDRHGEACWTVKGSYASQVDAGRPRPFVVNILFAHHNVGLDKYVHGATPTSDFYDQQAENHSPNPNPVPIPSPSHLTLTPHPHPSPSPLTPHPHPHPHPHPKPTPHPNPNEPRRPAFLCSTCSRVASPISPSLES